MDRGQQFRDRRSRAAMVGHLEVGLRAFPGDLLFRFLPDILRNQTHLDFENCAADTVLRKIANALHSGTGARLRSRILLIHSLPLHPWPHSRTSSREFRGGLQVLAARIYLLRLKVQPLLTVAPTVIAQISFLSYMGGDHYVAAVRKREALF
jgi:hypothetical protein